jgi:hypothetical protein
MNSSELNVDSKFKQTDIDYCYKQFQREKISITPEYVAEIVANSTYAAIEEWFNGYAFTNFT